ncbi:DDE-type integrase/transposase/recombinase (plasmid) [Rhodococcus globerulus]
MLEQGVVSWSVTRRSGGAANFGQAYARPRLSRPDGNWCLGEVFIRIICRQHCLCAVDQHGNVLDVLVESRRNGNAARRFFRWPLKGLRCVPRVTVTDKLGSHKVAHSEILASVDHRQSSIFSNRAENSHQPTRRREHA